MQTIITVLILLLAVALSNAAARSLPLPVPLPLIQIGLGALLASSRFGLNVTFDPAIFMLLFIPLLLFADGWRIPKRELLRHRRAVLLLALGLVLFTVAGAGYFIHWLIPAIPLPVAFALAAVLSPTDAVALAGIVGGARLPSQLHHILEGEALLNDASGLVAFKFALAAALTGVFSFWSAGASFLLVSIGGIAVGVALTWPFNRIRHRLDGRTAADDPGTQIILILLLPFGVYLLADRFGLSGILAAVAAGMTMSLTTDQVAENLATRVRGASVWAMVDVVFNGFIFILLGLQFRDIIGRAMLDAHRSPTGNVWVLAGLVLAIFAALLALRFVWVWVVRHVPGRAGMRHTVPGLRLVAVTSLAGVRGAITLAAVLSIPLAMPDDTPFPARDLIIFLASGVILCSLLAATIGLPLLLRYSSGDDGDDIAQQREERNARDHATRAAVKAITAAHARLAIDLDAADAALASEIAARTVLLFGRAAALDSSGSGNEADREANGAAEAEDAAATRATIEQRAARADALARQLKLAALRAERDEFVRLRGLNRINDATMIRLIRETDLAEAAVLARGGEQPAPY